MAEIVKLPKFHDKNVKKNSRQTKELIKFFLGF